MKKIVSLLMCLALLLGCCGGLAEGAPITWLTPGDTAAEIIEDGDRIVAAINEQLGIELTVQYVPEGNVEKVNVAMASGDMPDIVTGSYGTSATNSWIENGMLVSLNEYAESLPNLAAWLEKYSWSAEDGVYYGMPFITQYNAANALIIMRQDWLDNLNLAYPTTLDEMAAVLHAFTYDDPDQDGQDNTYGFTCEKPVGNFNWVFYAYGRQYSDYELDENGNVVPFFETECFVPSMEYIKALWDDGVIDPEFLLNDGSKVEEKFYQGKAGAMIRALYRHVSRHENNLKAIFPEGELAWGLPPVGPDGESFGLNAQGRSGMFTAITAACKNPDKAAAFLDFMVSPEGNDLLRLGIEGIHYTKDGDAVVFNEEERGKDAFSPNGWAHALAWGSLYWPLESQYLPANEPNRDRALQSVELATQAQVPSLIKQITKAETEYSSALGDIYNQYFLDMLQGNVSIEEGTAELISEWHSQGGDEMLADLNAAYQATK
jgi:ABC-type glycerol-3-phosphate transport system substrate-binding protein